MSPQLADLLAHGLTGSPWLPTLAYFAIATQLTVWGVTLYLHRSATHRGVDFHPVVAHVLRFWCWLTTAMVTKEWVAIHRKHHAAVETAEDPHSPVTHGIGKVMWHGVTLYQQACKDRAMIEQYGVGTVDDWLERRIYAPYPALGPTLLLFVSLALFGAVGLAMWAIQMLWIPIFAAGVINGLGHWWGYRNFETDDQSTNITPIAFFLGGEELHNNHHAFPSSAKFALRRYEFDIGWFLIRAMKIVGLAKVLRVAPTLAERPGISLPDMETVKALLTCRFVVMQSYFRDVMQPVMRAEAEAAGAKFAKMTGKLRRALSSDGRWLDGAAKARLQEVIDSNEMLARVVDYRRRLAAALERSGKSSDALLADLQNWIRDAERSGIAALEAYAQRLRGYTLASGVA